MNPSNGDSVLFQGSEASLNITERGNLYELNQQISLSNQEELNLTFPLDDEHNWKISKIQNDISDIHDTKNWVNNSGIQPVNIYRKNPFPGLLIKPHNILLLLLLERLLLMNQDFQTIYYGLLLRY